MRARLVNMRASAAFRLSIGCLLAASLVAAFGRPFPLNGAGTHPRRSSPRSGLGASLSEEASGVAAASAVDEGAHGGGWATHALLFSSLRDGIISNRAARSFLGYSLANSLLRERIVRREDGLESSARFSPCNGPDVDALNSLEAADELYERGQQFSSDDFGTNARVDRWAGETLSYLCSDANHCTDVRVLYIPTAMYALNPQSSNTPGKQRQRARADGKKRRTQLLNLLDELLNENKEGSRFNLLATTLDLDDGSLKQPVGSDDATNFPQNDKIALTTWSPHLVYVEGGNTFWLRHCVSKGGYSDLVRDACAGPSGAIYCGKSAGAIVAGADVATATWKGWDDPSVVPGRETYDDWSDCRGFGFAGDASFFPHMGDDWENLVKEKAEGRGFGDSVCCLREEDACCVMGEKRLSFVASGPSPC